MLNKDAILQIAAMATAPAAAEALESCNAILIPANYTTTSLEKYQPEPYLFRAKFKTSSIADFLTYINNNGTDCTGLFIDKNAMTAQAIIDMGDDNNPHWGHHRATLTMQKTAEFKRLQELNQQKLDQADLADFFLDYKTMIEPICDGSFIDFKDGLKKIRNLTLAEINNRNQQQGDLSASIDASSSYKVTSDNEPLEAFILRTSAYEGLDMTEIHCAVRYYPTDKGLKIGYRITGANMLEEQMAQNFKAFIDQNLKNDEINPIIGTIEYQ